MGQQGAKTKEISFSENTGDITVKVSGASVEFHTDGSILVYTNNAVKVCPIANDDGRATAAAEPKIGDKMPDGTVYAGISPDTGKAMHARPADASLTMTFNDAKKYAQGLNRKKALGHNDWHLPTKNELNVLFNNRAAIGGFSESDSFPAGWYWSSSQDDGWGAWSQRFSDGAQLDDYKGNHLAVRCVR
jgi:hypothetical protein